MTAAATLPDLVRARARERGAAIALRHKRRGLWRTWTWRDLADNVERIADALAGQGFTAGDTAVIAGHVRPHAIAFALAAQALGGRAQPIDPGADLPEGIALGYVFAEDQVQVDRVIAAPGIASAAVIAYADARGLAAYEHPALRAIDDLDAGPGGALGVYRAQAAATATTGPGAISAHAPAWQLAGVHRHGELIAAARARVAELGLRPGDNGLVIAPAAWQPNALTALVEWLVAGFTLSVPETAASIPTDLRELAPSYVFAPARTYHALHAETLARLPPPGTWRRRFVDAALAGRRVPSGLRDTLDRIAVRAPLRRTLGWTHVRIAVTSDAPLAESSARFFAALDVAVLGPGQSVRDRAAASATQDLARPLAPAADGS